MTVLHLSQTAERSVIRDLLRIELRVEETGAMPLGPGGNQSADGRGARPGAAVRACGSRPAPTMSARSAAERPARWRGGQSVILTGKDADCC